jgi:hypothetical protein
VRVGATCDALDVFDKLVTSAAPPCANIPNDDKIPQIVSTVPRRMSASHCERRARAQRCDHTDCERGRYDTVARNM